MSIFTTHTTESAPTESKPILKGAEKNLGFVPNLFAQLAESPVALKAYTTLSGIYEQSRLSPAEQQVVLLSVSVYNNCEFCVAAHSVLAKAQAGVDPDTVKAIRHQQAINDERLNALSEFAVTVVEKRGWVDENEVRRFLAAGYTNEQALEVIVGISLKTISNYTSHLADTQLNEQFASEVWHKNTH